MKGGLEKVAFKTLLAEDYACYIPSFMPHTVITLSKRMFWFLRGVGSSDVITCGIVIPPETIISVESTTEKIKILENQLI